MVHVVCLFWEYCVDVITSLVVKICLMAYIKFYCSSYLLKYCHYSPWREAPYEDAAERNALGGLSLDGFLSEVW